MKSSIRLLPLIIFAGTLALTLKVGTIWSERGVTVATATAANAEKPASDTKDEKKPRTGADRRSAAKSSKPSKGKEVGVGDEFDPSSVTQAEFQVLQRLAKRRNELDRLQADLALKEKLLGATEKRLNSKISELDQLKQLIQSLLKKHDAEQEKKLKSLVKIYETMKPKNAARIFERLEMEVLLDVVERMREAKTAPIFAAMDPTKANAITMRMADRRELPSPTAAVEGG